MPSKRPRCEFYQCEELASGSVHAQWTIADFVSYDTCVEHYVDVCQALADRRVDEERPFDMWTVWWDDEGDYVEELPRGVLKS